MSTPIEEEGNYQNIHKVKKKPKEKETLKNKDKDKSLLEKSSIETDNNSSMNVETNTLSVINNPIPINKNDREISTLKGDSNNYEGQMNSKISSFDEIEIEKSNTNEVGSFKRTEEIKGNMFIIYNSKKEPKIVIGPNCKKYFLIFKGIFPLIVFFVIVLIYFIIFIIISFNKSPFLFCFGLCLAFIHILSYFAVLFKDPGIPPKELWLENFKGHPDLSDFRICNKCKIVMKKEDKIEHCNVCNICISGKKYFNFII